MHYEFTVHLHFAVSSMDATIVVAWKYTRQYILVYQTITYLCHSYNNTYIFDHQLVAYQSGELWVINA